MESLRVGETAVFVFLQEHAPALRHHRHFRQREQQQLAVLADDRHVVSLDRTTDRCLHALAGIEDMPAVLGLRHHLVLGHQEAAAVGRGHEQRAAGLVDERSEEHTSELQSIMRSSYAAFCLKKKKYM